MEFEEPFGKESESGKHFPDRLAASSTSLILWPNSSALDTFLDKSDFEKDTDDKSPKLVGQLYADGTSCF